MPLTRPLTTSLVRSPLRSVFDGGVGGGGSAVSAFSAALYAIQQNSADTNIMVIGDSTGDETNEWVYLFAEWVATQHPTHGVEYRAYNDTGGAYDPPITLSTGSGANKIKFWNGSISGKSPRDFMGDRFATAIQSVPMPALIIWNHGHNVMTASATPNGDAWVTPFLERVHLQFPSAALAVTAQNPRRNNDAYAPVRDFWAALVADKPGSLLLEPYADFIAAGKPASWYIDDIHPNLAGEMVFVERAKAAWLGSSSVAPDVEAPWVSTAETNLLLNGDFAAFDGALPDGWTKNGTGVVTKDTAIKYGAADYSVKVSNTAGSVTSIRQVISGEAVTANRGGFVSLAVRRYYPTFPTGAQLARVTLVVNGTGGGTYSSPNENIFMCCPDTWHWMYIRAVPVPADATTISVTLYTDFTNVTGAVAHFDRAILVSGRVPRDMS